MALNQLSLFGTDDRADSQPDAEDETVAAQAGTDDAEAEEAAENSERVDDKLPSREELVDAYTRAKRLIDEKTREADGLRSRLEAMGSETRALVRKAEEETFLREVQEAYKNDPVSATAMLVRNAKLAAVEEMEAKLSQTLQDQRNFGRLMNMFLDDPGNAPLKLYRTELEFLILDKGLLPNEAADLIRSIEKRRDRTAGKRSTAARQIRERSAVETAGELREHTDKDKEFDKVLRKAKTLDEMFAGLRKLKV